MKSIFFLSLFCTYFYYCISQYGPVTKRNPKTLCDTSNKNVLVEHFFNIIFTDFYAMPPVCVCVQMCVGQSTYCYPNGCLKSAITMHTEIEDVKKSVDVPAPQIQKNNKQFLLMNNEKYDFMTDFLEKNYVDDSKPAAASQKLNNPVKQDLRPDPFKDKYSILGKYKRVPNIEIRYNLKEKVKNAKLDSIKHDGINLSKTRWPMNRQNKASTRKPLEELEKPLVGKSIFFTAMLPDNDVAEYPPKYFKRELTKIKNNDDENVKSFYALENQEIVKDSESFSFETLIENLMKSNYEENIDTTTIHNIDTLTKKDHQIGFETTEVKKEISTNATIFTNDTTSVISMNFTNENVDKNKYIGKHSNLNKTANINDMITYLSKQIEKQNNTSMEIAKRVIDDFNETTFKSNNEDIITTDLPSPEKHEYLIKSQNGTSTISYTTESTTKQNEMQVTKKNRQRVIRKLTSTKVNFLT